MGLARQRRWSRGERDACSQKHGNLVCVARVGGAPAPSGACMQITRRRLAASSPVRPCPRPASGMQEALDTYAALCKSLGVQRPWISAPSREQTTAASSSSLALAARAALAPPFCLFKARASRALLPHFCAPGSAQGAHASFTLPRSSQQGSPLFFFPPFPPTHRGDPQQPWPARPTRTLRWTS